jgi:fucose permease
VGRSLFFTSVVFVTLFGLSNAIVWPAIWSLAIHNLGSFINKGSAMLIMVIAGGALIPLVWGKFADVMGSREANWIMIPCYLVILFYAVRGYKLSSWRKRTVIS